jgi:hypothetical protein
MPARAGGAVFNGSNENQSGARYLTAPTTRHDPKRIAPASRRGYYFAARLLPITARE